jgi:hypothetical protein
MFALRQKPTFLPGGPTSLANDSDRDEVLVPLGGHSDARFQSLVKLSH